MKKGGRRRRADQPEAVSYQRLEALTRRAIERTSRLGLLTDDGVSPLWKGYRRAGRRKVLTLEPAEFTELSGFPFRRERDSLPAWGREIVMAIEITRTELSASDLRREAARAKDARASRRMLALALVLEGKSRTEAAESCGMDRQTLRDWVHRYNAEGLAGLVNRPLAGRKAMLSPEQMAELATIVETGPDPETDGVVRWRRVDLCAVVEQRFGVRYAERSMGQLLHRLGFARLSARPHHPQSDPEAQAVYKKLRRPGACRAAQGGTGQTAGGVVPG